MPRYFAETADGRRVEFEHQRPDLSTEEINQLAYYTLVQQGGVVAPEQKEEEAPGIFEQIIGAPAEIGKGFLRGLAVDPVSGLSSTVYSGTQAAGADLKPFEETGFGEALASAQEALAPSDQGHITQLASGVGSLLSFIPGGLLKGGTRLITLLGQSMGLGAEEARSRAEMARLEGTDVSPEQQFVSQLGGLGIGVTELLPAERMFRTIKDVMRGVPKDKLDEFAPGFLRSMRRIAETAGFEAAQEAGADVLQDLVQKGVYDPNLEVGQSAFDNAVLGGEVGAIAQSFVELATKGKRRAKYAELKAEQDQQRLQDELEQLEAEQAERTKNTMETLGVPDPSVLALPAPSPQVEPEAKNDPLVSPFGFLSGDEIGLDYSKTINKMRAMEGKSKLSQFSLEDLVDAGITPQDLDQAISLKTGYDGSVTVGKEDVLNIAKQKNIDTTTEGFNDFLRRSTGSGDIDTMSPAQRFSAFKSLDALPSSEVPQILPRGTNATRFNKRQYQKALKRVKEFFPEGNRLGRSSVLKDIKLYSGLENDVDAESLLETAIRNGDLETVSRPRYDIIDADGKTVRTYASRESAQRAADKTGFSVRESTSIDIAVPEKATTLAGGPDIRKGTFQEGMAPAEFEIKSPEAVLQTAKSQEEADAKAERLADLRQKKAANLLSQARKAEDQITKSQQKLESMEADGKADTVEYKKTAAKIAENNKRLQTKADGLKKQAETYAQPLEIAAKGEKPVTREGYTLFEDGKPVATFDNMRQAEENSVSRLPNDKLQNIIRDAPTQKGLMPKRLAALAQAELDRRTGQQPAGFGVSFTGTREQAEAKLAEAGIFTGEFQKKAKELSDKLRPIMDKLGLKDLRLNIEKAIQSPMGEADGYYAQRLIAISMTAPNPVRTLRHEGIHALKELGAFTPQQWKVLEDRAAKEWMSKYRIAERYAGLDRESQLEEAISDAFSDFDQTQAPSGMMGALFRKIKGFLEALRNAIRGMGFQTADSILADVEAGLITPTVSVGKEAPTVGQRIKYKLEDEPRVMSNGKIVGAPPGKATEADRKKLVKKMTNLMDHPFSMADQSLDWYENSGDAIREIARGNPELMERIVRLMALYSQANSLGANTTATIESIAQLAEGSPTAYAGRFPNVTAERIPALLAAPTMDSSLPGVDDKLMNFYRNLHDGTFKQDTFVDASTVDRWMMRLFGYPHAEDQKIGGASSVSNTQYTYAKDLLKRIAAAESKKVGRVLTPRQVQAALWTYVKNKTTYDSLSKEKKKDFVPSTIDFNDYVVRATANITWESRPSTSLNLIPGIHKANRAEQEEFNQAVRSIFVDEAGTDKIFQLLNNKQLYSSEFSEGAYENQIAPNVITKLVLQKADGKYLTDVADNYAAIIGYVTKQDAVPWYRADPTASGKDASVGYRVTPSVELTREFEDKLFKHLNEKMPNIGFTRIGGSLDFINFRDVETGKPYAMPDKKYIGELQEALQTFAPDVDFNVVPFRAKSGWISNDWKENPNGQGYLDRLRTAGLGDLRRVIEGWSADYDRIADQFGKEYGWSDPKKYALRSGELAVRPSTEGDGISFGERQPGAITVDAVHYGRQKVDTLNAAKYGTGARGAESRRVKYADDDRIKNRVYFYIPKDDGTMQEEGMVTATAPHVYIQRFNNVLGPGPEMRRINEEANFDANEFEAGVIDAGYDGYAVPEMGMMVILNNDVPVNYRGTRQEIAKKPVEETVQIGDRRYSLRQTGTKEFKDWFGDSKVVNEDGSPKVMYHGTARDITQFRPKQAKAIFVTESPAFAEEFTEMSEGYMAREEFRKLIEMDPEKAVSVFKQAATFALVEGSIDKGQYQRYVREFESMPHTMGMMEPGLERYVANVMIDMLPSNANIMPLYVRAENPFDYENDQHVESVINELSKSEFIEDSDLGFVEAQILKGEWEFIENFDTQDAIKKLGFDGFYVEEGGQKNLAVYDPNQLKSAVGNVGTFARTTGDIRYALALGAVEPNTAIVPDVGGNPDGNLGVLPGNLGNKPVRLLVGSHDDIRNKGTGANHILNRVLNDPDRMPEGAEETLEKIARTAQRTAQNYKAIYKDGDRYVLHDGKNSLILSPTRDAANIVTMFVQRNPVGKWGRPIWTGTAPVMPEFVQPVRGLGVVEREGRVGVKPTQVIKKRVITPSGVLEASGEQRVKGTLGLKKKFSMRDTLDAGTVDAIDRTTTVRQEKGFVQRMMEAISPESFAKFRQGMINKYEAIEKLSRAVGEKFGEKEMLADTSAIASALFSDRASGVAASSFRNGVPVYKNGFTTVSDMDGTVKGLIPILEPLAKYGDPYVFQAFQFYAATRRGRRLSAEGRENLFTQDDIRKGELLARKYPEFKQVFDEYQQYNQGLVNFMKDTGVISDREAELWTQNWDYIPFYRQIEGESTAGPNVFSAIAGVAKPKKLKGGTAPLADFMETIVRNSRAAIEMGMKNVAAQKVVRDVVRMGQGEAVSSGTSGLDVVTVKEAGQTKHYRVDDPLLVESLKGLNLPQLPFVEILAAPASFLRNLVTKDPGFMLANLMRDSLQAWVTTGTNITPIIDTFKQYGAALANSSPEVAALAKAGLFTGYDFAGDVKSGTSQVEKELRKRTKTMTTAQKATMPLTAIWDALERGSTASDVATRAEVYKRVLKETGNEAEAMYQAMEVMNFSRKGNSAIIRIMTAAVPFLNARIQGLDVLYRAGFGKMATATRERQQKAFITRGMTLLALSSMYWMLASDSEEYKRAEQEVRDNYWIIPMAGVEGGVRIPIPFEIGTIFKVFPERILEYFFGMDTGRDLKQSIVRNITSTLAFNPIPQAILPIVENTVNYSFFTGRPIVGRGMERIVPQYQVTPSTSLLAQEVADITGASPLKIDNLIGGYTGTIGTYVVMALDAIMRDQGDPTKATMKAEQMPVIKRFFASPEASGTISAYYDLKQRVDQAAATASMLERTGRIDDLKEFLKDQGKMIALTPYIRALDKDMKDLRDARTTILQSKIDPDTKRNSLDAIRRAENALTARIKEVKKKFD